MPALLAVAALGDGLSMLLLPPGGELNPVARAAPLLALALKLALSVVLLELARRRFRHFQSVLPVAASVWLFGLTVNLLTIAR